MAAFPFINVKYKCSVYVVNRNRCVRTRALGARKRQLIISKDGEQFRRNRAKIRKYWSYLPLGRNAIPEKDIDFALMACEVFLMRFYSCRYCQCLLSLRIYILLLWNKCSNSLLQIFCSVKMHMGCKETSYVYQFSKWAYYGNNAKYLWTRLCICSS